MGSEAYGLAPVWLSAAQAVVRIPMHGAVDSLNLSAATASLLYEVVRQRMG
jgi:TrmH family RNA methyltransferase